MDITPLVPKGKKIITGYGGGGFKINHEFIEGSLIVFADRVLPWNGMDYRPVLETIGIELLLIGTGATFSQLDPVTRAELKARGISADVMDTGAACRTFNVLLSEERRVAAALIAI